MIVKIDRLDDYGRGIALINNKITFIENALPEEVVDIEILKENKKYNEGKVTKYLELSPNRIEAKCPYYTKCGGCNLEHFSYSYENTFKENKVKHLLNKFTNLDENIVKDIKYDKEYSYRNKIILHGNNKKLGLYNKGSNNIIPINKCLLVNNKINEIINILNMINVSIKEVLIRTSNDEKETIVKIDGDVSNINSLLNKVDVLIINNKLLSNNSSIISNIGKYKYYLSSNSFFQINEYLTKTIYDEIEKIVQSIKPNKVLDLYCGTGTIGIYISKYAGNVIGIDSNISNIKDAEKNKLLNNIDNIKFICSKVETKINGFNDIDLIIVDPPRSGLDKITLTNLLRIKPQTLIYTSCDPVTLMRDLNYLNKNYEVKYLIPINNFPRTYHCESIAVLERKQIMSNYVRVMDELKSNASGEEFKLDEVITANVWNPTETEPEKMGGFNFSTEDKILRYIFRGDTIYDVIIPDDAEVINVDEEKGIYRANKIIVSNPKIITEDMVIDIYKKSTLPTNIYFQCIYCLLFRKYINASRYIINDIVNKENINEAIKEFEDFASKSNGNTTGIFDYDKLFPEAKKIYKILLDIRDK